MLLTSVKFDLRIFKILGFFPALCFLCKKYVIVLLNLLKKPGTFRYRDIRYTSYGG